MPGGNIEALLSIRDFLRNMVFNAPEIIGRVCLPSYYIGEENIADSQLFAK